MLIDSDPDRKEFMLAMRTFLSVLCLTCGGLLSCTGDATSVYGDARSGSVSVNIGPMGPLVGIGDSAIDAAREAAEAYLSSLRIPLTALQDYQIETAADRGVQAASNAASNSGRPLTLDQQNAIRQAVMGSINKKKAGK